MRCPSKCWSRTSGAPKVNSPLRGRLRLHRPGRREMNHAGAVRPPWYFRPNLEPAFLLLTPAFFDRARFPGVTDEILGLEQRLNSAAVGSARGSVVPGDSAAVIAMAAPERGVRLRSSVPLRPRWDSLRGSWLLAPRARAPRTARRSTRKNRRRRSPRSGV